MAAHLKNLSEYNINDVPDASQLKFGIVVSTYNDAITNKLLEACQKTLLRHGTKENHIIIFPVPGAFELIYGAHTIIKNYAVDAVIVLGCVIKGDTDHDKYINHAVAQGIVKVSLQHDKPVIFGLLTPNTLEQALERAGGIHGNKGVEAAVAALKMTSLRPL